MNKQVWTKFISEYFEKGNWVEHVRLFMGDLSNVDITADSRFSNIENARRNTKFIELTYE
jgi:hypothetical protein